MATVTGLTADRMLEIEAASVVDGDIVGDNLILTKHDGSQVNAGNVRGPAGPQGPVGSDLTVLSSVPVLEMGVPNQIRAGRQLTPADFGNLGLSVPIALWNLSDLSDTSGNGRSLSNKGAVTFNNGILGVASNAAQFAGSTAQVLYISDTGVNDPFRIKVGTWGCWFKCSKKGTNQYILSKMGPTGLAPVVCWASLILTTSNGTNYGTYACDGTTGFGVTGLTDVSDDRWHFGVSTYDGTQLCAYLDGQIESQLKSNGLLINQSAAVPVNIGGYGGDAGSPSVAPFFGRVDEVFVTSDVLNEDQVRNLYCARIGHTLGAIPSRLTLNIRRRRRGAAVIPVDFPTLPSRLHNFSAGSLSDEGSNNIVLTNNGGSVSVAGVDGSVGNAFNFSGTSQYLSSTDAGLPAALATRSYGCWIKSGSSAAQVAMIWGGASGWSNIQLNTGLIYSLEFNGSVQDTITGPFIGDGHWHHIVVVGDNAPVPNDGTKRKLYVDGRLIATSTVLYSIVGVGANGFRIGAHYNTTGLFVGQIDGVFVYPGALTAEQISVLYNKSLISFSPSPKNVGDHVEAMSSNDLLVAFDSLDSAWRVDLAVAI